MKDLWFYYERLRAYGKYSLLYLVLYIASLFYICRNKDKVMRQVFVWPVCIAMVTVFNPIIMNFLFEIPAFSLRNRYHRFFWMLPMLILNAYVFALLIDRQKDKWKKVVAVALVLSLISVGGGDEILMRPGENIYKIPDEVIELSDKIDEVKLQEDEPVLCDMEVFYLIRQYNPAIKLAGEEWYLREQIFLNEKEREAMAENCSGMRALVLTSNYQLAIPADVINAALKSRGVKIWAIPNGWYADEYLQELDIYLVGTTEQYGIYRCK